MMRLSVIVLVFGILLGLGLGVLIGWVVFPVEYVDTPPIALRADYKDDYLVLIASAYAADHNLDRARQRLATLGYPDLVQAVDALAQRLASEGKDDFVVVILANDLRFRQPSISIALPLATMSSPLANVEFPTQEIQYPSDWPADLLYPDQFIVVDTSSGTFSETDKTEWAAKLRFAGDINTAADLLSSFFVNEGWQVIERSNLDGGGLLIIIQKNSTSNGIVIFDRDSHDAQYTSVVTTIFP